MSEVRCLALVIPTDEVLNYWMKKPDGADTFKSIAGLVGVHPTEEAQYLLFRDPEDRKQAYNKIHAAYPETLCAYELRVMFIDKRYIKEA